MNEVVICSACNLVRSECECVPEAWEDLPNDRKSRHSSKSVEHFTPPEIVWAARHVLDMTETEWPIDRRFDEGTLSKFDLDPASCETANNTVVHARAFYGENDDSLGRRWEGTTWLNPPGGIIKDKSSPNYRKSQALVFWKKLVDEYHAGRTTEAFFLAFSLELLQSSQQFETSMGDFTFCIPSKRLRFYSPVGAGCVEARNDPTHANAIVYLPSGSGDFQMKKVRAFRRFFQKFGKVVDGGCFY